MFTEREQNVRKWWLRFFLLQFALNVCNAAYRFIASHQQDTSARPYIALAITLGVATLFNYAIYYCSYTKRGTKLLTLVLILSWVGFLSLTLLVIGTLVSMMRQTSIPLSLFANDYSLLDQSLTLATCAVSLPYYLLTVRLRKLNKAHRKSAVLQPVSD